MRAIGLLTNFDDDDIAEEVKYDNLFACFCTRRPTSTRKILHSAWHER